MTGTRRVGRRALGALGVATTTAGLGLAAGRPGVFVGLLLAVAWALAPAPYAVAAGQVLAVAALPADAALPLVAAVELGLLAVLAAPLVATAAPVAAVVGLVLATGTLVGAVLLALAVFDPVWPASLALAGTAATVAYGLHRVERVRLGAVS